MELMAHQARAVAAAQAVVVVVEILKIAILLVAVDQEVQEVAVVAAPVRVAVEVAQLLGYWLREHLVLLLTVQLQVALKERVVLGVLGAPVDREEHKALKVLDPVMVNQILEVAVVPVHQGVRGVMVVMALMAFHIKCTLLAQVQVILL